MEADSKSHALIRGKQRKAVYNALKHPVSGRQILESVKKIAPSMTYQDLRHILRDFQQQGLATCLNPAQQTGRFYALSTFDGERFPADLCAKIGRAKIRLAVLREVAKERFFETRPLTATQIKKQLRESYPLGLNHVLAALKFLSENHLVETAEYTSKRELKIYRVTELGKTILGYLEN
jgi:Fe2+ or Zn2+ uptake regulation protein